MAKRELSADYRFGIQLVINMLGDMAKQAREDISVMMDFPDRLRAELEGALSADIRRGMEDCLAGHLRVLIEDQPTALIDGCFDPTESLVNPEAWYGFEQAEADHG